MRRFTLKGIGEGVVNVPETETASLRHVRIAEVVNADPDTRTWD